MRLTLGVLALKRAAVEDADDVEASADIGARTLIDDARRRDCERGRHGDRRRRRARARRRTRSARSSAASRARARAFGVFVRVDGDDAGRKTRSMHRDDCGARRDVLARRRRRERDARARVLLPGRLAGVGEGDELPGGREEAGDVEDGARRERRGPGDGGGFGSHGGEGAGKTGKARRRSTGGRGGRRGRGGEVRGGGAAGDRRFIPSCTRCTEARLAR